MLSFDHEISMIPGEQIAYKHAAANLQEGSGELRKTGCARLTAEGLLFSATALSLLSFLNFNAKGDAIQYYYAFQTILVASVNAYLALWGRKVHSKYAREYANLKTSLESARLVDEVFTPRRFINRN